MKLPTGEDHDKEYRSSYERRVQQASTDELRQMRVEVKSLLSKERENYSRSLDNYETALGGGEGVRGWLKRTFGPSVPPPREEPFRHIINRLQEELNYIDTELEKREKDGGEK